jgi:hypothetical protein
MHLKIPIQCWIRGLMKRSRSKADLLPGRNFVVRPVLNLVLDLSPHVTFVAKASVGYTGIGVELWY